MKDYKVNGKYIEITLDNDKVVKCDKKWAETSVEKLGTDMEDVLLMWLEDNDYLINEEQEELDQEAKGKVKLVATNEKPKKKTQKERVVKENPLKEQIIETLANTLKNLEVDNLNIENKGKLITFSYKNEDFKVDLVQKRKKKAEK